MGSHCQVARDKFSRDATKQHWDAFVRTPRLAAPAPPTLVRGLFL
jgi:hypothetical protein